MPTNVTSGQLTGPRGRSGPGPLASTTTGTGSPRRPGGPLDTVTVVTERRPPVTASPTRSAPSGMSAPSGPPAPSTGSRPSTLSRPSVPSGSSGWSARPSVTSSSSPSKPSGRSHTLGGLGRGVVEIPNLPTLDPSTAVLADPRVPEGKRFCSRCAAPVGRSRHGRPGREEGYCTKCGHQFSFTPKLARGDLVGGQYEILGCLAHGGLGWIYLGRDQAVSGRWVVLKGLLDTGDAIAMAAAVAEKQFLAQVEHPAIVKIFNFVEHRARDGQDTGYIVMEYLGGSSLKDLINQARAGGDPRACLPLGRALAYVLAILPALGYLHSQGLIFCDFKPDNILHVRDQVKLIDLGAVRRADDTQSAIYGTPAYQAPEIGRELPSPGTDLYSVGRTLAVMTFPFDFQGTHRTELPGPREIPLLARYESYHRFLRRAVNPDPTRRFRGAADMAEQLEGVLREVAAHDGTARPGTSVEFTPEIRSFGARADDDHTPPPVRSVIAALPVPRVDGDDPAAGFLAGLTARGPAALIDELAKAPITTTEVVLRSARARIEVGDLAGARGDLDSVTGRLDWRVAWHRGLTAMAGEDLAGARRAFEVVYDMLPGEAAPKLAIAVCAEALGDIQAADRHYRLVWRTDRAYPSAAFGLARTLLARGERANAVAVLDSVPENSSECVSARLAAVAARVNGGPTEADLIEAGDRLTELDLGPTRRARAARVVLEAALSWVSAGNAPRLGRPVLGHPLTETALRLGLERLYRVLATQAVSRAERIALVDQANRIRPKTWF